MGKTIGWLCGTLGAIFFIIYFFNIGLPILSILEIGLTILMAYRFIAKDKTNRGIENMLGILTGIFIIIFTILTRQEILTFAQFFGALGMLIGTYLLISTKQEINFIEIKERYGWLLYGIGHFFTSCIGYQKHEWIFFVFQAWQMLLCFGGFVVKDPQKRKKITKSILVIGAVASLIFSIFISTIN